MKNLLMLSLVLSTAAFAESGTSVFEDVRGTSRSTISVAGNTAKVLFDGLSADGMFSIDASESASGTHTVYKSGENYNCSMSMGLPGKANKYSCAIPFVSKSKGTVGIAGVAYPASNSGITNYPGTSSVSVRPYQNADKHALLLTINGASAQHAFDLLNVRVNSYGAGVLVKEEANNISCQKRIKKDTPVKYSCDIMIEQKSGGMITHPGVG